MEDLVVGHPGSFAREEANLVELNSHIPHASKRENMRASTSFMAPTLISLFYFTATAHLLIGCQDKTGEENIESK